MKIQVPMPQILSPIIRNVETKEKKMKKKKKELQEVRSNPITLDEVIVILAWDK